MKAWLPKGSELLSCTLYRSPFHGKQNSIEFTLQSLDPRAQGRRASSSEADEQVNVVGHHDVPPDADTETGCPAAICDENFVYFGICKEIDASVSIERYEINRRVEALEDEIQPWRPTFEYTLHDRSCTVPSRQRTSPDIAGGIR
jgi:hypothetical protein